MSKAPAIEWLPLEPPCGMSKGQKKIIEEENKYREMFYSDRENRVLDDPHLNMINPFDPKIAKTFIFEEEVKKIYVMALTRTNKQTNFIGQ